MKKYVVLFLFISLISLGGAPAFAVFTPPGEIGVSNEDKSYAESVLKSITWDHSRVGKFNEVSLKLPEVKSPYAWSVNMDDGKYIGIDVECKSPYFGKGGNDVVLEINPRGNGFYISLIDTSKGCVIAQETYIYKPATGVKYIPPEDRVRGAIDDNGNIVGLYDVWGNPKVNEQVYSFLVLPNRYLTFTDLPVSHWANQVISGFVALGYIKGYPDHTFKPEQKMTRAEFAAVFGSLLKDRFAGDPPKDNNFAFLDLRPNHWSYNMAYGMLGYMSYDDTLNILGKNFEPDKDISREEVAAILYATLKTRPEMQKPVPTGVSLKDIQGSKYLDAIEFCAINKFMIGYPDGTFRPKQQLTRAEIAALLSSVSETLLEG